MTGLLTEAEAKERACPFFRYVINEADVVQRQTSAIYAHSPCAASACIAWRSGPPRPIISGPRPKRVFQSLRAGDPMPDGFERLGEAEWPPGSSAPSIRIRSILPEEGKIAQGYCGIAGKPE